MIMTGSWLIAPELRHTHHKRRFKCSDIHQDSIQRPASSQHFTCEKKFRLQHRGEIVNQIDRWDGVVNQITCTTLYTAEADS